MKDIKFRLWDDHDKEMIYDDMKSICYGAKGNDLRMIATEYAEDNKDIPLMQYVGIKDKNGKEIYEGDIYHNGDINIKYKVIFDECQFIGQQIGNESTVGLPYWIDRTEVIGNIHKSPELLGKAK